MNFLTTQTEPTQKKRDRYNLYSGTLDSNGYFVEKEIVGHAFRKQNSSSFKIKLWMFINEQYFVVPTKEDQTKYSIFSIDEYISESKELKTFWNKIGTAELDGNYLNINFHLMQKTIFLSLFEVKDSAEFVQLQEVA